MTAWFAFSALVVGCILLHVRHERRLDRIRRRRP